MFRARPLAVAVFALWTLLVWGQRIVNIVARDGGDGLDLVLAALFVAAGVAVAVVALRPTEPVTARRVVGAAAALTSLRWLQQMVVIPLRDHPVGFVVVHLVLGGISIGLAVWAWRSVRGERVAAVAAS